LPADTTGLPPAPSVEPFDPEKESIRVIPNALSHPKIEETNGVPATVDPVVQLQSGEANMPSPIENFEGLSNTTGVLPPDTDGQVGPNHYVQIVNATVVGIYDKSTGALLYPSFLLSSLWPGTDPCGERNDGDPIVLYDQLADRWLLTQFRVPDPYYECIAISKTGTPTNNPNDWYLYSFLAHGTKFNDYPKLGVWPDGYYMSANQFTTGWAGVGVWVFDRAAMLTGAAATFQYFDLAPVDINYWALLPSNLMGSNTPPSGAPNYFVSVDQNWSGADDIMHIFEFHTDWATPANSTFSLVTDLVVDPFDYDLCANFREQCIHQPDGAPQLEALSFRAMMHLWYRNFGTHEALVVNHTVDADGAGRAGIRWYEVRGGTVDTTLADASIYQQGTYAPADGLHRWMGSIAMDQDSNIALGYSVSSTTVYPSIRYAGRLATDPLNTLPQAEVEIIAGSGVQTHSAARWGDYSAMSVDPVDDCTFWYTQEYIETTGSATWQTRIASFKFPSCPSGLPDTPTPTNTPTPTDTSTPGPSPTPTNTPTATSTSTATATPTATTTPTATSTPGGSTILVVDDDDNAPDVRPYYTNALDSLGETYDIWDTGNSDNEPNAAYLSSYTTVIWFSGDEWGGFAGPGPAGETSLAAFLSGGNCLFISSQDYHWDRGLTSFMSTYLGASSMTDDVTQATVTGEGGPFWGMGPYSLSYPFTDFSDNVSPDSTAEEAFIGDQGDAAVYKDNHVYRTTFWGFPFVALPTAADRQDAMDAFLDFCDTGFSTIASFVDVPKSHWAWEYIEGLYRSGITSGCSTDPLMYCPDNKVTRVQMAIFLMRGINGPGYTPPPATGIFADVDPSHWTADWIEAFYALGITSGCDTDPLRYCPNNYITRTQMAVFLVRVLHGSSFVPPPATGIFDDVVLDGFFDGFIEQLYNDGITQGCATSPLRYCPNGLVSREEMAAFLARTFDLPLP
jgi:hypothetical protein